MLRANAIQILSKKIDTSPLIDDEVLQYDVETKKWAGHKGFHDYNANVKLSPPGTATAPAGAHLSGLNPTLVTGSQIISLTYNESGTGNITWDVLAPGQVVVHVPATASCAQGEQFVVYTASGKYAYVWLDINANGQGPIDTVPPGNGWFSAEIPDYVHYLRVPIVTGGTAVQNTQAFAAAIAADTIFQGFGIVSTYSSEALAVGDIATNMKIRQIGDVVYMTLQEFTISSFSGTLQELNLSLAQIPAAFRPLRNVVFTPQLNYTSAPVSGYNPVLMIWNTEQGWLIYPNDENQSFANGINITAPSDIEVSWVQEAW